MPRVADGDVQPVPHLAVLPHAPAAVTEDEDACADDMRAIVRAGHMPYSVLQDDPGALLRCSKFMNHNGALWTRFTVQYNLYAGSITVGARKASA